ncbi:hypothetical protein ACHAWF_005000 [Thalassiosira exigua]
MAAVLAPRSRLCDPFARPPSHLAHPPEELAPILALLAVDRLVDSRAPPPVDLVLVGELAAVDRTVDRAQAIAKAAAKANDDETFAEHATRPKTNHTNAFDGEIARAEAKGGGDEGSILMELVEIDRVVDAARAGGKGTQLPRGPDADQGTDATALCDPYARKRPSELAELAGGVFAPPNPSKSRVDEERRLRDDAAMMELLACDESIDGSKRLEKLLASDEWAILEELHEVDREVGGAKARAATEEEVRDLWEVDRLVDGRGRAEAASGKAGGGKRSIFSVKEKYAARVAGQTG